MSDNDALGAVVGLHTVKLSDRQTEVDIDAGYAGAMKAPRIPEKYGRAPLTFEVRSGGQNEASFELTTE
jgi:hypothetical protein